MDIPSTEVIQHWVAWGYTGDDDAGMEHSPERVAQFNAWLAEHDREKQAQAWEEGYRDRAIDIVRDGITLNPYRQGENNE